MDAAQPPSCGTITSLLEDARNGRADALDELFEHVYSHLKRLARSRLRRAGAAGLDGTGLVSEACERLLGGALVDVANRRHFYYLFGRAMRNVLADLFRSKRTLKRGGRLRRQPLIELTADGQSASLEFLDLHEALAALEAHDAQGARVVELRYFGGRSLEEIAELLDTSFASVRRDWDYARAWLHERLSDHSDRDRSVGA